MRSVSLLGEEMFPTAWGSSTARARMLRVNGRAIAEEFNILPLTVRKTWWVLDHLK
jgi:hypothetical protein